MAAHSNRNPPSPRPINPTNPRNSQNNNPFPRTGNNNKPSILTNPITPANSPSDFVRQRPFGKESSCLFHQKDCEEKENDERDLNSKCSKLQSPARVSKNFMSPTISAASKFTPSPRKKVLMERNDPVRTSISLSDGKAMFFSSSVMSSSVSEDAKSDMDQKSGSSLDLNRIDDSEKKKSVEENHPVSKPSKRVSFSSDIPSDSHHETESQSQSESVLPDSDNKDVEPSLKNNDPCYSSISPLDADPSLHSSYDPKTNYLSPRPQFLRYKPDPRIKILMNKENGLDPDEFKLFDDSFMEESMSENSSDSEYIEESQTEKEMEANASTDIVLGAEETFEQEMEANPQLSEEKIVQETAKKTWTFFSRLVCFSMLVMMVLIASASILATCSNSLEGFVLNDLSLSELNEFYHQSRVAASAKESLDILARCVDQARAKSVSFISKLVADEFGRGERVILVQYMNLSDLGMNSWNGGHSRKNEAIMELVEENLEEEDDDDDDGLEEDLGTEIDSVEEEENEEVDYVEKFEKEFDAQEDDDTSFGSEQIFPDSVMEPGNSEDINENRGEINAVQLAAIPVNQETEDEATIEVVAIAHDQETGKSQGDTNLDSSADITVPDQDIPVDATNSQSGELVQSSQMVEPQSLDATNSLSGELIQSSQIVEPQPLEDKFLARNYYAVGISSIFAALFVSAAFIYNQQYSRNSTLEDVDKLLSKNTYQKNVTPSQNWQTDGDEIGESSCGSEMSSFEKGGVSYYSKSEGKSLERKVRKYNTSKRESLASSSMEYSTGSPSYGSFTTFEKIPIKHANGEEEIITPVRRSSRIRSHYTSP